MSLQTGVAASIHLHLTSVVSGRQPVFARPFSKKGSSRVLPAVSAKQHSAQLAQSRNLKVVELRRGDLTWRHPPWHFDCTTTADALQLDGLKEIDNVVGMQPHVTKPFIHTVKVRI